MGRYIYSGQCSGRDLLRHSDDYQQSGYQYCRRHSQRLEFCPAHRKIFRVVLPKHYDQSRTLIETLIDYANTEVWSYNPLVQEGYSHKYTIDFLPINARILQGFVNQSLGLTGTQFWRVDNWTADPWNNAEASRANMPGEGHYAYPGEDVGLPDHVFAGVRMKLFRVGSEDYEYIQILKDLGQEQFAIDITRTVVVDFHTWTQDKDVLYGARKLLGDRIHRASNGPGH